ncbi:hypothetical protein RB213_002689, partial [Colletotrichum asianum]
MDQGRPTCSDSKKDSFLPRIIVDHIFARFERRLIFSLIVRMPILAPQLTASLSQHTSVPRGSNKLHLFMRRMAGGGVQGHNVEVCLYYGAFCCVFVLRPEVSVVF